MRALLLGIALACLAAGGTRVRIVAVDDAGDTLRLDAPARRIVSLDPTITELLFAIGAGSALVGRTDACDFPAGARAVPSLGGGIPPTVEAVVARLRTDRLDAVPRLTRMLGELTGASRGADSVAETYARDIVAWTQPLIVLGAGSYVSEAVELAGGRNIFDDISAPSAQVTLEAVVDRAPHAVIAMDASGVSSLRPEWPVIRLQESAYNHPGPRMPAAIHALRARLAAIP